MDDNAYYHPCDIDVTWAICRHPSTSSHQPRIPDWRSWLKSLDRRLLAACRPARLFREYPGTCAISVLWDRARFSKAAPRKAPARSF